MWVFAGVLVALAAIVAALLSFKFIFMPQSSVQAPSKSSSAQTPVFAPSGELTPSFPKELILDDAAKLSQSYLINYSTSTKQYTANFTSSDTMLSLYQNYKKYFASNGWTVVNDTTSYTTSRGLYVRKGTTDASVAIIDQGKTRSVVVSYLQN